jgi:hypothetical protein
MAKQTIPGKAPISLAPVKALSESKPGAPAVQAKAAEVKPAADAKPVAAPAVAAPVLKVGRTSAWPRDGVNSSRKHAWIRFRRLRRLVLPEL